MNIGVVTFPGSLDDRDTWRAIEVSGANFVSLWHKEEDIKNIDAIVLPGGFSYGDYLRCGAIAALSPIMNTIVEQAERGLPVLGICNGFQILCEAKLLPGVLMQNHKLQFICQDQKLQIVNNRTAWTSAYAENEEIIIPIKNMEGCYVADEKIIQMLEDEQRIVALYKDGNPNGSVKDIAGICNEAGNVVGLMPHPEHAIDQYTGPSEDGIKFFLSRVGELQ